MMIAQRLYESGRITYMRTDNVNLSALAIAASKEEIIKTYGEEYNETRNYHVHAKGAQGTQDAVPPSPQRQATTGRARSAVSTTSSGSVPSPRRWPMPRSTRPR